MISIVVKIDTRGPKMTLCWIQCHQRWDPTKMGNLWEAQYPREAFLIEDTLSCPKVRLGSITIHPTSIVQNDLFFYSWRLRLYVYCLNALDPSHPWSTKIRVLPSIFLPWHIDRTDFVDGWCSYLVQERTWAIAFLTIPSTFFSSVPNSNPNMIQPTLHSCLFISIHVQ